VHCTLRLATAGRRWNSGVFAPDESHNGKYLDTEIFIELLFNETAGSGPPPAFDLAQWRREKPASALESKSASGSSRPKGKQPQSKQPQFSAGPSSSGSAPSAPKTRKSHSKAPVLPSRSASARLAGRKAMQKIDAMQDSGSD
jgi:hypothetical protein